MSKQDCVFKRIAEHFCDVTKKIGRKVDFVLEFV